MNLKPAYPLLVTAAVIENSDSKFLLTQRPDDVHNGGRWEFPGGKVDFGEDLRSCLQREIDEELGIVIEAKEILDYSSHVYPDERVQGGKKHVVLMGLHANYVSGDIVKKQIKDFVWVTVDEMLSGTYDITEADIPIIQKLQDIVNKK